MSQSWSARQSYSFTQSAPTCRKVATARDSSTENVGYSQLLPSTKYWSPGTAHNDHEDPNGHSYVAEYLSLGYNDVHDCSFDNVNEDTLSNYELRDDAGNLRSSPERRQSHRNSNTPLRRTRTLSGKGTPIQDTRSSLSLQRNVESVSQTKDVDAWTVWLEEKAKHDAAEKQKKKQEIEKEKEWEKSKEMERNRRDHMSKLKRQEWLAKKLKDEIEEKLREEKKISREEKEKVKEKEEKKIKNQERLKEWKVKKLAEERDQREKIAQQQQSERQINEERKQKADESYEHWVKEANSRPSRVSASLGYTGGRLIGFYDWSSYPSPSFYNPIPWEPIQVPLSKPKKNAKSATGNPTSRKSRPLSSVNVNNKNDTAVSPLPSESKTISEPTQKAPSVNNKSSTVESQSPPVSSVGSKKNSKSSIIKKSSSQINSYKAPTKSAREILSPPLLWKEVMERGAITS